MSKPLRVGRKLNRSSSDGKATRVKHELRFTDVDSFCARRLFGDYPVPVRLLEELWLAPVVDEKVLDGHTCRMYRAKREAA